MSDSKKARGPRKTFVDRVAEVDARIVAARKRLDALVAERDAMVADERVRVAAAMEAVQQADSSSS